jgi:hypothetical protein
MKAYTGIGSRRTPLDILNQMSLIAESLQNTYVLRSGHAPGADIAFEDGISTNHKEIFIPWKGFNGSSSPLYNQPAESFYIASQLHPNWKNLKESVKKLMARNVQQVLGLELNNPSKFVICWTPDACMSHKSRSKDTGGTGLAISVADNNNIPIINMKYKLWIDLFEEIIK